ncbi:MAG: amidase family protein, partial [Fervidicoccus sp.]
MTFTKKETKVIEQVQMIKEGTLDPEKPFEDAVEQAIKNDPKYNIFITLTSNEDKSIFKKGKLSGIPIAVKDNISTKGIRTTCASKILEDYVPGYSATVVERIEAEGGIIFGKTNMDEFAMGALGTTSAFGPTLNNLNIELSPGGSSSGSAVAVSSGTVKLALGSDTGGSIRLPAAWTGIYGFKPTYGFVSRYGLISYADSMDQIGPLATNISDLILLFSIISGSDERDPTSQFPGINKEKMLKLAYSEADVDILKKLKLIVIKNLIEHPQADEGLINEFWKDLKMLESYGASIELIDEPLILKIPQIYYIIAFSEASSNLARFDGLRYGKRISNVEKNDYDSFYMENRTLFGWEVKRRI